jgi:hypothetical protein
MIKSLVFCVAMVVAPLHDFHASITRIDYNAESKLLEITVRVFTDDMSKGLDDFSGAKLNFGSPMESPNVEDKLPEYLKQHFTIQADGKPVSYKYLGKELEDDATWIYLESGKIKASKSVEITNTILTDHFEDQANIINLNIRGQKNTLGLNKGTPSGTIELD